MLTQRSYIVLGGRRQKQHPLPGRDSSPLAWGLSELEAESSSIALTSSFVFSCFCFFSAVVFSHKLLLSGKESVELPWQRSERLTTRRPSLPTVFRPACFVNSTFNRVCLDSTAGCRFCSKVGGGRTDWVQLGETWKKAQDMQDWMKVSESAQEKMDLTELLQHQDRFPLVQHVRSL